FRVPETVKPARPEPLAGARIDIDVPGDAVSQVDSGVNGTECLLLALRVSSKQTTFFVSKIPNPSTHYEVIYNLDVGIAKYRSGLREHVAAIRKGLRQWRSRRPRQPKVVVKGQYVAIDPLIERANGPVHTSASITRE